MFRIMNTWKAQLIFPSEPNFCNLFEFLTKKLHSKNQYFSHLNFENCEINSIKFDSSRVFHQHQEHFQIPIQFLFLFCFVFIEKNGSIINSSKQSQTKLVPLFIESFPKIPRMQHEAPWFGKSYQEKKEKKTYYLISCIDSYHKILSQSSFLNFIFHV